MKGCVSDEKFELRYQFFFLSSTRSLKTIQKVVNVADQRVLNKIKDAERISSREHGLAGQRVMTKKKDWASMFQDDTEGLERRMYSNIYCPESQRGNQPLQSCVFLEQGMPISEIKEDCVRFVLRGDEE